MQLRNAIEPHCEGNPFSVQCPLKSLVSSAVSENAQQLLEELVSERLMSTSTQSIWDPMKKLKLTTFAKLNQKTSVRIGDKVIKLREERDLFGRFLIILSSHPGLVNEPVNKPTGGKKCS